MSARSDEAIDRSELMWEAEYSPRKMRALNYFAEVDTPKTAREVAEDIDRNRRNVYDTLYDLEEAGLLTCVAEDPMRWELAVEVHDKIEQQPPYASATEGFVELGGITAVVAWLIVSGIVLVVFSVVVEWLFAMGIGLLVLGLWSFGMEYLFIRSVMSNGA